MDVALLSRPNPSSGTPVYRQIVEQISHGLETGAVRPGETLPPISPMAEALVVPPTAVARAYLELEQLSLVVRTGGVLYTTTPRSARPGIGTTETEWAARARELESASEVQQCLLPRVEDRVEGLDCAGVSRPALSVGGDYYDFVPLPGRRVAIALGDVCGKGVPAAILMAAIRGYLHGATVERQSNPRQLVSALNSHLHASVPANRFATFFYGLYDVSTRTLEYVTAGHHPPVLIRRDDSATRRRRLASGGPALGLMPDVEYPSGTMVLERGDVLVAFTDGITEAMSAAGDEWGEDRLVDDLDTIELTSATAIAERVLYSARRFACGVPQHDDMTAAVVRVV
jgi:sigma-B regulation protein RsbU (phosphoserine phosphatase)